MFDFANSAFPTVALTAFGGPYFAGVLAADGVKLGPVELGPAGAWGVALSLSMLMVTVSSPVMGAVADRSGKKRYLLAGYVMLCVVATAGLAMVPPGAALPAFLLYIVANFAFEGAYVFYNAFLPELAPPDRVGRLSGYGWALGYMGGMLALALALPLLPERYSVEEASQASLVFWIVAVWYLVFSLPALFWLRDRTPRKQRRSGGYLRAAVAELAHTVRTVRSYGAVGIFLIAFFLYNDGITTVIEFTGIYTEKVLSFTPFETTMLFLLLNLVAAPGALLFGSLLDRVGGKKAIGASLILWIGVVVGAVLAQTKAAFWPVAGLAAVVIGATQASSRALMARLAPRRRVGEFMGFLALSGKASAVFGPTMYGLLADAFTRPQAPGFGHRVAVGAIGVLFVVAFFVLLFVDERGGVRRARDEDAQEGAA
jgi:UMF1 family MFS transporter